MAGNSEKDNRSLGGKVKDKVMSWITPNATEADKVVVQQLGEISLCLCCYQPMLTTYDGCTACKEFKVFSGIRKYPHRHTNTHALLHTPHTGVCKLPGCSYDLKNIFI